MRLSHFMQAEDWSVAETKIKSSQHRESTISAIASPMLVRGWYGSQKLQVHAKIFTCNLSNGSPAGTNSSIRELDRRLAKQPVLRITDILTVGSRSVTGLGHIDSV